MNLIFKVVTVTLMGFISQIGGQLGLFLGSSIISLFQLIIFVIIFLKRAFVKRRDRNKNQTEVLNHNGNSGESRLEGFNNFVITKPLRERQQ